MASCRSCKPRNLFPEGEKNDRLFIYLSEEAWNGKLSRFARVLEETFISSRNSASEGVVCGGTV